MKKKFETLKRKRAVFAGNNCHCVEIFGGIELENWNEDRKSARTELQRIKGKNVELI